MGAKRRNVTREYKEQAARIVVDDGLSAAAVARDQGLSATALRRWADHSRGHSKSRREAFLKKWKGSLRQATGPLRGAAEAIGTTSPTHQVLRKSLKRSLC